MTQDPSGDDNDRTSSDPSTTASLSIGELARRTGIGVGNLRMWEARHGFPRAVRLPSGHRRYHEAAVEAIQQVQRRRESGVRLETAIAEVAAAPEIPTASVYAELRVRYPHLIPYRLRKSTLVALTWALEDECCARAQSPWLFGAFQRDRYYRHAERRWQDLSRTARGTWAMAAFATTTRPGAGPVEVALAADSPMLREWSLVCVSSDYPAVLAAWELPGQHDVADSDRLFESLWTLEDAPARDAARCCARMLADQGEDMAECQADLDRATPGRARDLRHATDTFNRVVAYVDRLR